MGAACARPEPPSPAEAAVVPGAEQSFGPLLVRALEVELAGGWAPFEPRIAALLADAEARGLQRVEYHARRQSYVVDLQAMEQVNRASGTRRRLRRADAGARGYLAGGDRWGGRAGAAAGPAACGSTAESLYAPPVPEAFPELMQVGEAELGRLKASRAALDAFILAAPQARALVEQGRAVREENAGLQRSAVARLASASQQADAGAEALLQQALEAPRAMDLGALADFKERFLQQKVDKQRGLVAKKRLECSDADWHALCLAPATTRGGL